MLAGTALLLVDVQERYVIDKKNRILTRHSTSILAAVAVHMGFAKPHPDIDLCTIGYFHLPKTGGGGRNGGTNQYALCITSRDGSRVMLEKRGGNLNMEARQEQAHVMNHFLGLSMLNGHAGVAMVPVATGGGAGRDAGSSSGSGSSGSGSGSAAATGSAAPAAVAAPAAAAPTPPHEQGLEYGVLGGDVVADNIAAGFAFAAAPPPPAADADSAADQDRHHNHHSGGNHDHGYHAMVADY
jgi:hypothetical protein